MPSALVYTSPADGGIYVGAIYSGAVAPSVAAAGPGAFATGPDVMLQSGRGRLCQIVPHQTFLTLSGVQLSLYDGAAPVSGGPIDTSGHKLIGGLAAGYGVSGQLAAAGVPIKINMPFTSGLCLNSRSGQPGVTISWMTEPLLGISG